MEPVWVLWEDRRRGAQPIPPPPLARVNPSCQMTAPSDCIWRQFHLDSNFTQTDIGSPHFVDCIFEEACNLEACKLAKPGVLYF